MSAPLLCRPEEKAEYETANGDRQLDYIAYLVNDLKIEQVREPHILELHALAIANVYPCGGKYRDALHKVVIQGSPHQVPHESSVPYLVRDLVEMLNQTAAERSAIWRAAYAL